MNDEYDPNRRTDKFQNYLDNELAAQGSVLWLPAKEDLPERAVRRAHGQGAIEEKIFNHPIVVISCPEEDKNVITSLQGKRLDELYNRSNEFHTGRRSWYLPISPTPEHPDAISKKTKKRFPTLVLASSKTLQFNSYVNIRHVYKIDSSLLRPYENRKKPEAAAFRFEHESMIKMLARGRSLTLYEPGQQYVRPSLKKSASDPTLALKTERAGSEMMKPIPIMPVPAKPDLCGTRRLRSQSWSVTCPQIVTKR